MEKTEKKPLPSMTDVIGMVIQIPGVKVSRPDFLKEQFKDASPELMESIVNDGPVKAGCSRKELYKIASRLVYRKTVMSTGASFLAGMPGGLFMAATIPADMAQFYGVALGLAQEIAYLYGAEDLWSGDVLDEEKVTNQLILYCGVMMGAGGAAQAVRVMSSRLAQQIINRLPQQALTKTVYYPIVKSIAKAFGVKMTKGVFAKGVSKAVPIIGGVVSGGITYATLKPMGMRLVDTLDNSQFDYSESEFQADFKDIVEMGAENEPESKENDSALSKIRQAKNLFDEGVLTEEEFLRIKERLISEMQP